MSSIPTRAHPCNSEGMQSEKLPFIVLYYSFSVHPQVFPPLVGKVGVGAREGTGKAGSCGRSTVLEEETKGMLMIIHILHFPWRRGAAVLWFIHIPVPRGTIHHPLPLHRIPLFCYYFCCWLAGCSGRAPSRVINENLLCLIKVQRGLVVTCGRV